MIELKLLQVADVAYQTMRDSIQKLDFMSGLERDEIETLVNWSNAYSAATGTFILTEGDNKACLCILVEGEIDIFKEMAPEEHIKIANIKAGGVIGEMGIIDGEALSATAIASTDSIVLIITGEDFENMVNKNEKLGNKLLWKIARIISLRLRKTTGLLADFLDVK